VNELLIGAGLAVLFTAGLACAEQTAPSDNQPDFDPAEKQIRRTPPSDFPDLPAGIKAVLAKRGCGIPQPTAGIEKTRPLKNVIRGEFFVNGQEAWAVLCSSRGSSTILVFRDRSGAKPEEIAPAEDKNYLQGDGPGKIAYSREIDPVGRKYIMDHFRAYGGPEPPPIDHQGIDDVFLEKASVTYYWYHGKWLQLQGAD